MPAALRKGPFLAYAALFLAALTQAVALAVHGPE